MDLIGSCETMGYTVEAYFPEPGMEDLWTIWVVKDGRVIRESSVRIDVDSAYGMDQHTLALLEQAAEAAVLAVMCGNPESRLVSRRTILETIG
ncbi:MAG: hypothetical protein ACREP2_05005 [Rhodanobacteraceae bacterium]